MAQNKGIHHDEHYRVTVEDLGLSLYFHCVKTWKKQSIFLSYTVQNIHKDIRLTMTKYTAKQNKTVIKSMDVNNVTQYVSHAIYL